MAVPISFKKQPAAGESPCASLPTPPATGLNAVISAALNRASAPFDTTLGAQLQRIKSDEVKDVCIAIRAARAAGDEATAKALKEELPVFTPSGRFHDTKSTTNLVRHSGVVALDFDGLDLHRALELRETIRNSNDPHILSASLSAGGNLFVLLACDPSASRHKESFDAARSYFQSRYGESASVDLQCSNVNRLRYLTHDPEIFIAQGAVLPIPYPVANVSPTQQPAEKPKLTPEDVRELLRAIPSRPEYDEWLRIISAVASVLPEADGVRLLKEWSPEEKTGEYQEKWGYALDQIGVGTLVYLARENGWVPSAAFRQKLPDAAIEEAEKLALAARLARCEFGVGPAPVKPVPRLLISGIPISTPGNITTISAQAKTGKTAQVAACLAATIVAKFSGQNGSLTALPDCLGVTASQPGGRAVLHFDTEQSNFDHWQAVQRALKRAGTESRPAWLRSFGMAGASPRELCRAVRHVCETEAGNNGIFAVFIDGVADLVADVNEAEECNALVADLQSLAIKYACPFICVVHENPAQNNGKARGHLGSQLERKSETNLRLIRTEQVTQVYADKCRGAPIPKKNGPCFEWNDAAGMHISVPASALVAADKKTAELRELAEECIPEAGALNSITYTALKTAIVQARGYSAQTAERRIQAMTKAGVISKGGSHYYREEAS